MSRIGTELPILDVCSSAAIRGKADDIARSEPFRSWHIPRKPVALQATSKSDPPFSLFKKFCVVS
jgi:hypothetical protein